MPGLTLLSEQCVLSGDRAAPADAPVPARAFLHREAGQAPERPRALLPVRARHRTPAGLVAVAAPARGRPAPVDEPSTAAPEAPRHSSHPDPGAGHESTGAVHR